MEQEIWKDIEGYENLYQVSSMGRIKSLHYRKGKSEGYLSFYDNNQGYPLVTLCKNKKQVKTQVSRIVAKAFIPNPDNKPFVDHIDTNPHNNNVDNLRWVTQKENCNNTLTLQHYSERSGPNKEKFGKDSPLSKVTIQYNLQGDIIKIWDCLMDIKRNTNYDIGHISSVCKGKRKSAYGYKWEYKEKVA